mgnify:CR=1 FL=1
MSWQFEMALDVTPSALRAPSVPAVSMRSLSSGKQSLDGARSGIASTVQGARQLGILTDDMLGPVTTLLGAAQLTIGGMMLVQAYQAAVAARASIEAALASAETAAHAAALNWGGIALAAGAAVAVYSGIQLASGSWTLPAVDVRSPIDRARAARQIREVQ